MMHAMLYYFGLGIFTNILIITGGILYAGLAASDCAALVIQVGFNFYYYTVSVKFSK